jgi:hypothetical protein
MVPARAQSMAEQSSVSYSQETLPVLQSALAIANLFAPSRKDGSARLLVHMKTWKIIADNLSKAGWSLGWVVYAVVPGRWAAEDVFSATGGANERLQRLFVNLVALMQIDGTPSVALEAGGPMAIFCAHLVRVGRVAP